MPRSSVVAFARLLQQCARRGASRSASRGWACRRRLAILVNDDTAHDAAARHEMLAFSSFCASASWIGVPAVRRASRRTRCPRSRASRRHREASGGSPCE
jgi:hypothetical protein